MKTYTYDDILNRLDTLSKRSLHTFFSSNGKNFEAFYNGSQWIISVYERTK